MTGIDAKEAASALSDIEQIVRRVRQSRVYDLASQIMIMAGVLVLGGNLAHWTWPRYGGYIWIAVNVLSLLGCAIGLGITVLTLIGYFFVGGFAFLLWMAVVNGGGLILGGLWMRWS